MLLCQGVSADLKSGALGTVHTALQGLESWSVAGTPAEFLVHFLCSQQHGASDQEGGPRIRAKVVQSGSRGLCLNFDLLRDARPPPPTISFHSRALVYGPRVYRPVEGVWAPFLSRAVAEY